MIKVYFNNTCSLCRIEVNHYKKLPQEDIDWIDVTDNKLAEAILKKSKSDLIRRMHVSENGKIYTGGDAFVKLWSKIPRYKFLSKILSVQPFLSITRIIYEFLAFLLFLKNKKQLRKNG